MKLIPLTKGQFAIVDDEDYERVSKYKWRAAWGGYCYYAVHMFWNEGKRYEIRMHRFILNAPDGKLVDHIDYDGLNNRIYNIRICSHSQSQYHRRSHGGTSKFKGVSLNKINNKWQAQIKHNRKSMWIGQYEKETEAAKAYDKKARELFGDFAHLNFPILAALLAKENEDGE